MLLKASVKRKSKTTDRSQAPDGCRAPHTGQGLIHLYW